MRLRAVAWPSFSARNPNITHGFPVIVDPDFLDHWRTGMVVDALGDPMAPMYILRLWAHCQERKSDMFTMPTRGLKAQCKFPGDADAFEQALREAGFIERQGAAIHVCGWAEKNASLLAAWENGAKGGRPKKKPSENPQVTQGEPSANPNETQTKPIREEKSREEQRQPSVAIARGTRLASDWHPGEAGLAFAAKQGLVNGVAQAELEKFRDHWAAKPGKDGTALDWQAKWRTWCRNAIEWRGGRGPPAVGGSKQTALEARNRAVIDEFMRETNEPI
jgi:hypothetical protein